MPGRRMRMRGWVKWAFIAAHLVLATICVLRFAVEWGDRTIAPIDWLLLAAAPAILIYTFYTVRVGLRV